MVLFKTSVSNLLEPEQQLLEAAMYGLLQTAHVECCAAVPLVRLVQTLHKGHYVAYRIPTNYMLCSRISSVDHTMSHRA